MKTQIFYKRKSETVDATLHSEEAAKQHTKFMRGLDSNNIKRAIPSRRKRKLFYRNNPNFMECRYENTKAAKPTKKANTDSDNSKFSYRWI
jgi:hypothetical protein